MIIRTWFCLNRWCKTTFDGEGDHPPCPRCGGIHVQWVPKPVAIRSEKTKQIDRTVAQLTGTYGDKDYRSPRRHERMAPPVNPTVTPGKTRRFEPVKGWAVELPLDQNGAPVGICAPTGVTAVQKAAVGARAPIDKRSATATGAVPKYEARHNPPGGIPK
jgi:hypothetical protein